MHTQNAESFLVLRIFESASVIRDDQLNVALSVAQGDLQDGGIRVGQGIDDCLAADVEERIGNAQIQGNRLAIKLGSDADAVRRGPASNFSQLTEQIVLNRRRRLAENRDGPAGLLMTASHQLIRDV